MNESIPCYVGRASCGCIVSCMVDDPAEKGNASWQKEIKKYLRETINDGLTIDRSTVGEIRQKFGCCHKTDKTNQQPLFA